MVSAERRKAICFGASFASFRSPDVLWRLHEINAQCVIIAFLRIRVSVMQKDGSRAKFQTVFSSPGSSGQNSCQRSNLKEESGYSAPLPNVTRWDWLAGLSVC